MTSLHHAPTVGASVPPDGSAHGVAFYDSDADLVDLVVGFLRPALSIGTAVLVATADHLEALTTALGTAGADATAALRSGRLATLDASETLDRFMVDDAPHPPAFDAVIGDVLDRATRAGGPIRVYGEMVTVLWQQGRVAAAMQLEERWNELAATHPFDLLCGYPSALFAHPSAARRFGELCGRHTDVTVSANGRTWLPAWATGSVLPGEDAVRWRLPAAPASGAWARTMLRQLLASWELPHLLDEAELLTTELVTNAVLHARSQLTVEVRRLPGALHVEVTDEGAGVLKRVDCGLEATHGRGLLLVDAVSSSWGTRVDGDAKTVWFQLGTDTAV